ncbi:MAG: hypothetical protein HY981_02955 [Candidatus Magasanikbacteria bacterium]|nr:hypothetical protein [Candidatus Magasanikbacteria bacterium]
MPRQRMPRSEGTTTLPNGERKKRTHEKTRDEKREDLLANRLKTEADIEAQKKWQSGESAVLKYVKGIFDGATLRTLGLPKTDALISDLARASQDTQYAPADEWHKDIVERLRHYRVNKEAPETDVLRVLVSAETSASVRQGFFEKEVRGLLEYTENEDIRKLRELPPPETPHPNPLPQGEKEESGEDKPVELPPPAQDEIKTSMDEMEKQKEGEKPRGYFSVHPFWGGYYREQVYEEHIGGARWKKLARQYGSAPVVEKFAEERVFRGQVRGGTITDLPMPYGFAPNAAKFKANNGAAKLIIDQNGNWVVDARGAQGVVEFSVMIGKSRFVSPQPSPASGEGEKKSLAVRETYAGKKAQQMLEGLNGSIVEKSRAIKRFVQGILLYSNESALNAVYEGDRDGYFAAIEKNKKADCDVANAYYINLLSRAGIKARMALGHYVKMKDADGAAVMHSGSRHAWSEVWSDDERQWVRFDATPAGDPTLDEDRPDEKSEDEAGPGDYGEQEAKQITDEELAVFKEKIEEAQRKTAEETATPEERANKEFATKAGCTPEQADHVRKKIAEARALHDVKGRNVRDSMAEEFQKVVDSNLKEVQEYRGPVTRSQGDILDDKKMVAKDMHLGTADPIGYALEVLIQKMAQEYGGIDVLLVCDRSGSMEEIDPTTNRPKKEEQQLAAFLVLDGTNAFSYKTEAASRQDLLVSPLSVRTGVIAFQDGNADVLKSAAAAWTPKEQYAVWSGMESNIGGGTPAHLGLIKVLAEIERLREQDKKRTDLQSSKPRLQVVMVFMDGGVANKEAYLAAQKKLEDMGVYVSSWGMTESARTVEAYPEGHCVPSARDMIDPIAKYIVEKAQRLKLNS